MKKLLFITITLLSTTTHAADFPQRPVRIVVPSTPGGALDILSRMLAQKLPERWGQPLVVDNRSGAGGIIGSEIVAKSDADGHTLLVVALGYAANPFLYDKLPYRTPQDFAAITVLASQPNVLVVHPAVAASNLRELIANAKQAGRLPFGTAGTASTQHVAGELLKQRTGLDLVHVPYKGGGPAIADVVGGQLTLSYTAIAGGSSFVKAGKLKALGVSSLQRSAALPDVPTFIESGLPGFAVESWIALFAPAGTPRPIIDRLQRDVAAVLAQPEVRERYSALGLLPGGGAPEQLAAQMKEDYTRWEKVIREAGIKIE